MTEYTKLDQLVATTIRMLSIDGVQKANSGHPGLPLGAADIATVLWGHYLKHNPADPQWFNRDRFILSAGHGSMLLYSLLHVFGYPMPLEELQRFRQWGSVTPGHPEYDPERGVEMTTGPLGQGISTAVGIALAERILAARFNKPDFPIIDHYTFVLASDGDLMEGVSHEAASLAGHLGLGKLIVFYDDNHVTIDGPTELAFSDNVLTRFKGYGWHTQRANGHNFASIDKALRAALAESERPSLIACRTHIGYKSPKQDDASVHGAPLGEENVIKTKKAYRWPLEPAFYIPGEIQPYVEEVRGRGKKAQEEWNALWERYQAQYPAEAQQLQRIMKGELPEGWEEALPQFPADKPLATRVASGRVLEAIAPRLESLVGGSADLTPSNNTKPKEARVIRRNEYGGSYIHFGVREHGMGAILNGLALHGFRPYGGTFLVFSDYMRPALRLAALMRLPVIYVFTHDSIGLGEDGPTHQPVEHIMALRAVPNLVVIRPADANETVVAWKVALQRKDGPTALLLTRQNVPVITKDGKGLERGAYVLAEAENGRPQVVLLATGSEVSLALKAREQLSQEGIGARVISMPSFELFDQQPEEYRRSVLPGEVPTVAIEAGVSLGWHKYLPPRASVVSLERFGASAPEKVVFAQLGFTVERIVNEVKHLL
ncbi:MAG: transketolase [Anaerolineales bacterium]|nr:transketolase [Anaerolineales bacterium]MDW8446613.1 transketolase [Anaerolineales bacterium]